METPLTAWGKASSIKQDDNKQLTLVNATYTTCPPSMKPLWQLKAPYLKLNTEKGLGTAKHLQLLLKNKPILYFPYLRFPIDQQRHSGFLMPTYHFSSESGSSIAVPYYWNIAPNFDATLTPTALTKRGLELNNRFRYLTKHHQGNIDFDFVPFDSKFKQFKQDAQTLYAGDPLLSNLEKNHNTRYSLALINRSTWTPHWNSRVDYQTVSDDYYIRDFNHGTIDNSNNQLLQLLTLNYATNAWNFSVKAQQYQTLHPIDENNVEELYAKLPQLQFNTEHNDGPLGLHYSLNAEAVRFTKKNKPGETIDPIDGNRFHIQPVISLPWQSHFASITPRIQLPITQYTLEHGTTNAVSRVLPMIDTKAKLYFDRNTTHYRQTLEPTIYYLYVPYREQDAIPLFDTTANIFSYESLFRDNRFSGNDRIGDTHQITFGINTRFIDQQTGEQKATAGIGVIHYFKPHQLQYCDDVDASLCIGDPTDDDHHTSPIAGTLHYDFDHHLSMNTQVTVDTYHTHFNNQRIELQYIPNTDHIFNVGYQFIQPADSAGTTETDLKQIDFSTYLKLNNHWHFMGRWNYNWSRHPAQTYLLGLSYEDCCWAVRLMGGRTYTGVNEAENNTFDNMLSLQLALKGLGQIGVDNPKTILTQSIDGFTDHFGRR